MREDEDWKENEGMKEGGVFNQIMNGEKLMETGVNYSRKRGREMMGAEKWKKMKENRTTKKKE
jgi:hypothetical protein